MRVLTVNYDAAMIEAFDEIFEAEGWTVRHANTPKEGLAALDEEPLYDAVLLEQVISDLRFVRAFLDSKGTHAVIVGIPVIVTTCFPYTLRTIKGVMRVLRKPFRLDVLFHALRQAAEERVRA